MTITASTSTTIGLQVFANVNLSGGANPTGSVLYRLFGPGDTACTTAIFTSTVPVTGISMNSAPYSTAAAGTYRWMAQYGGDSANNPVGTACSDPSAAVIVGKAYTGLSISAPAPVGGTIHGAVTLAGGWNPTGSLTFYLSPPGSTFCDQTIFTSTVAVAGNGTYNSSSFTPTVTGTFRWRAAYTGDDNSHGDPVTACLDQNAGVAVTSVSPPADRALLTSPVDGQSNVDTTRAFAWSPVTQGQAYYLAVGTAQYGTDLVNSGVLPASQASYPVPALPTGRTLYATLLTETNGSWTRFQAITFTAAPGLAAFTNPVNGQAMVGKFPVFTWSTIPQGQSYYLAVGTSMFATNLVNSGPLGPTQNSYNSPAMPPGTTIYATLLTETNGSWTRYQAITFTTS